LKSPQPPWPSQRRTSRYGSYMGCALGVSSGRSLQAARLRGEPAVAAHGVGSNSAGSPEPLTWWESAHIRDGGAHRRDGRGCLTPAKGYGHVDPHDPHQRELQACDSRVFFGRPGGTLRVFELVRGAGSGRPSSAPSVLSAPSARSGWFSRRVIL